jgi:hypothetical protein
MPVNRHVVGIAICISAVAAVQYLAGVWSLGNLHPGGEVEVPVSVLRKAEIGRAVQQPFVVPLMWIGRMSHQVSLPLVITAGVLLIIAYGTMLYLPVGYLLRKKKPHPSCPSTKGDSGL